MEMPDIYVSFVLDYFSGERIMIGAFDTPQKASNAAEIAINQAISIKPDNTPRERFGYYWVEVGMNEFNTEELCSLIY